MTFAITILIAAMAYRLACARRMAAFVSLTRNRDSREAVFFRSDLGLCLLRVSAATLWICVSLGLRHWLDPAPAWVALAVVAGFLVRADMLRQDRVARGDFNSLIP